MPRVTAFILVLAALALASPSVAELKEPEETIAERRGLTNRGSIVVSGILVRFDTRLTAGPVGTSINLEDTIGLDREKLDTRAAGTYRIGRRHRVGVGYLWLGRESVSILTRRLVIDDVAFDIGAIVDSRLNTKIIDLNYVYSFKRNGNVDVGLLAGVSVYEFTYSFNALGSINGMTEAGTRAGDEILAPVPVLGAILEVTIKPRLFFRSALKLFTFEDSRVDARLIDLQVSLDWYPWAHVGFQIGLSSLDLFYLDKRDQFSVDYDIQGLNAGILFAF